MKLSAKGMYFLAAHEGIVPAPYLDSQGYWTYGIGHAETSGIDPNPKNLPRGEPSDLDSELDRVFAVFMSDMDVFSKAVSDAIKVSVAQHEFDAAVSFHYNTGAIGRATWVKSLNSGDRQKAAREIMNWKKPPEIIGRREAEQDLFANGNYGNKSVAVFGVSSTNQPLYGRVLRRMTMDQFLSKVDGAGNRKPPVNPFNAIIDLIKAIFGGAK